MWYQTIYWKDSISHTSSYTNDDTFWSMTIANEKYDTVFIHYTEKPIYE
jgi:hypothetical protein